MTSVHVDVVSATGSTDCCSCSPDSSSDSNVERCSLRQMLSSFFCCRKHRAGSQVSLIKSGLASASSSVGASKRTLTSHDGVLAAELGDQIPAAPPQRLPPSSDVVVDVREPPSYLRVSRCVGGYSTFTSYNVPGPGPRSPTPGADPVSPVSNGGPPQPSSPVKGGQHCRVTVIDDVVADVRTLSNGRSTAGLVNGIQSVAVHRGTDDKVDGLATSCRTTSPTAVKDGSYFLSLVDNEQRRLQQLCCRTECHLQEPNGAIPEEVQGKMRAAIGKANLLTTKKFRQFRQLCKENLSKADNDPFQTTDADLAGFWDMVLLQVDDVDRMFNELEELSRHDWTVTKSSVIAAAESRSSVDVSSRSPSAGSRGRGTPKTPRQTPTKSATSEASSRSRQEAARQRLAAAKMAGRQRKASDSDKDVEIFVA